jgi:hypothetical protein
MRANHYCSTTRASRRTRLAVGLTLLVALIAVASVLSGCGGKVVSYTDSDFGFSFQYNDSWTFRTLAASELTTGVSRAVEVFDPTGSDAGDNSTYDSMRVEVIELDPAVGVTMDMITTDLKSYLEAFKSADASLKVTEAPTATTIGGMPCMKATYTFTTKGTDVRCTEYWILGPNDLAYSLYTQSSVKNWDGNVKLFDTFVSSFKSGGSAAETTTTAAGTAGTTN